MLMQWLRLAPPWTMPVFHKVCFCIQEHPPGRRTDATPQLTVQPRELEPARSLRQGPHPIPHGLQVAARQPASAEGADGGALTLTLALALALAPALALALALAPALTLALPTAAVRVSELRRPTSP